MTLKEILEYLIIAHMIYIFNKGSEVSYQTLGSNSKVLVDKQQELFNILWEVATPLSLRRKELEQEKNPPLSKNTNRL